MNTYKIRHKETGKFFKKQCRGKWMRNPRTRKLRKTSEWNDVGECFTEKQIKAHYKWLTTNNENNVHGETVFAQFDDESEIEIVKYELV